MAEAPDSLEPFGAVQRTRIGREATEPMREDIRLLGTILGDTVREQNGDEVFDLVERARIASFRVRRSEIERAEVAQMFDGIDIHRAIPVIRAFSHFALLANVAEDIHRERRRAIHVNAGDPPQDSTLAATYQKLDSAHLDAATVAEALTGALVSPVITAHPTETRRRTVFDAQHRITQLMRLHARGHSAQPTTAATSTPSCAAKCSRCGRPRWFGCRACRSPTRSRSACGITRQRFSTSCRKSTPKSATPCAVAGPTPICSPNRSCGRARGSAATVTATRTSPPTSCDWPPAARPTPR